MGLVGRFDRKLESTVEDAFARVFGGSVAPGDVETLLRREAADGIRTLAGGLLLAPNEYVITLSVPDYQKVITDPDLTPDTFAKHLAGYLGDQGWQTYGEVVVRFDPSPALHTGQVRAHGVINPDVTANAERPPLRQSDQSSTAEPGVTPMSDNPTYRPGHGRPGDEYYDDRYGRPEEPRPSQDPRAPYEQGGYPQGESNYPPRQAYPDQGGYPPSYEQRPPAGYGQQPYDQGYRQPPPQGGYPQQGGGYGAPPSDYDYGRPPAPRHEDYGRPSYPDQGGYEQQGYNAAPSYGRPDPYAQPAPPAQPDYGRYTEPPRSDYDYGQPAPGGYSPPAEYRPQGMRTVILHLDDGSGRTYQLREGANVVGRGQDAQFRLPDTGVSRRHLEVRWDGQIALLSDLNSTNGTTVNNAPVQEWQLDDGDVIRLGHSEIVVRIH
jgi:hypothetical protein